jgi:fumarate reductase subunit D
VAEWEGKINAVESAIREESPRGEKPFGWLVLDDQDLADEWTIPVMFALMAAAKALGVLDARAHPWGGA